MSLETQDNIRHYFVVFGVRNADGSVHFETDDGQLMERFGARALLEESTEQWTTVEEYDDAALEDNDEVISDALVSLFAAADALRLGKEVE